MEIEKEYKKDLLLACSNDLKSSMDRVFEKAIEQNGANETTLQAVLMQYYNVDTRNKCITEFGKTTQERDYLDKTYNKILNEVVIKWKNHIKYAETQAILENQKNQEKECKTYNILNGLGKILKWTFLIVFGIVILLFKFISECAKEQNKKHK